MTRPTDDLSSMRACVVAILETLPLDVELRLFGDGRRMPPGQPYGDFWVIGGSGFMLNEMAQRPIVRRVGLVQLTMWQPLETKLLVSKALVAAFNRGFVGRRVSDLSGRSYVFDRKAKVAQVSTGSHMVTVGRVAFTRDETAADGVELDLRW